MMSVPDAGSLPLVRYSYANHYHSLRDVCHQKATSPVRLVALLTWWRRAVRSTPYILYMPCSPHIILTRFVWGLSAIHRGSSDPVFVIRIVLNECR